MGRRDFLEEVMMFACEARTSQTEAVNAMPLYPTEAILWDDNQVPDVHYTGVPVREAGAVPRGAGACDPLGRAGRVEG